jgi:hypothetical protein
MAVTSSNSMMRGFVIATWARMRCVTRISPIDSVTVEDISAEYRETESPAVLTRLEP